MARLKSKVYQTPELMTKIMSEKLARKLPAYAHFSNAYLATFSGYIEGPVWCMDLYIGKVVHLAILEEFTLDLAIYEGSLRPNVLFNGNESWEKQHETVKRKWNLYKNKQQEWCLKYTIR